jgi:hypothetical protein
MTHDLLWTMGRLSVDGLEVQLRGFRKSHHFIPAGARPFGATIGTNREVT